MSCPPRRSNDRVSACPLIPRGSWCMTRDFAERLRDIVEASAGIVAFLSGMDFDSFDSSDALTSQVYWKLSVIGEAANRALRERPDLAVELPELVNLTDVRNRVIHGYDSIDNLIVWTVVHKRIPPVIEQIRRFLAELRKTTH